MMITHSSINRAIAVCLLVFVPSLVFPQISGPDRFSANAQEFKGFMPATPNTVIASKTFYIDGIYLVNNSGSAVTVRIRDRSTDCNSAVCPIIPDDFSLAASTPYVYALPKISAGGGITISASSANAVVYHIVGTY
jgi:hypothetical protein